MQNQPLPVIASLSFSWNAETGTCLAVDSGPASIFGGAGAVTWKLLPISAQAAPASGAVQVTYSFDSQGNPIHRS